MTQEQCCLPECVILNWLDVLFPSYVGAQVQTSSYACELACLKNILLARCRICFFDFATQLVEWLLLLAKCYRRSYDSLFGVVSFDVEQLTGYQSNAELEAVLPFPLVSS
ncbi:hypothetical protein T05_7460 [Trichinella murrelli]|uniref:Uncharacterized protein n=1 Tax=Trichinella murrelli TaxID=144512 RepID=A0A0V0U7X2_9BILA|nr:hypothetical protein T05_7460 [Trichinella murrelli]